MSSKRMRTQKRKLGQASNNIDRCIEDLIALHELYKDPHPEYADFLTEIVKGLFLCQDMMRNWAIVALGSAPENLNRWMDL